MARIALVWELGGGLGHILGLRPIADALRARGHDVDWVVRDIVPTVTALGERPDRVYQAPAIMQRRARQEPVTFAEILATLGYGRPDELGALIEAWQAVFDLRHVDAVVADFAPTALLAAGLSGVPSLTIGNGFTLPPRLRPMPEIQPWRDVQARRLRQADDRVRETVNEALAARNGQPIDFAADVFRSTRAFQCTFAALDHYGPRPDETYHGPLVDRAASAAGVADLLGRRNVFAYLIWRHAATVPMLRFLRESKARGTIFVTGAPARALREYASSRLTVTDRPQDLVRTLSVARLLIGHGGLGTTTQALLAGVPALMLPSQIEQALFAHRVAENGLGIVAPSPLKVADFGTLLERAMDPALAERVGAFAAAHADYVPEKLHRTIADGVDSLLSGG